MCRWLAYSGTPILLDELLYRPRYSLIDQSLHSRMGVETTNGDGFGVGWYGTRARPRRDAVPRRRPGVGRRQPARTGRLGVVAAVPGAHPGEHRHAGAADQLPSRSGTAHGCGSTTARSGRSRQVKRDLVLAVDPELYPFLIGSTDSEVMFHLALTFGLRDDPVAAVERMVGFVESVGRAHGVPDPIQMTVATTDGDRRVGVPLLQRGQQPVVVLQHGGIRAARAVPGEREPAAGSPTRPASWSPNRSANWSAPGSRCRSPATASSSKGDDMLGDFHPRLP